MKNSDNYKLPSLKDAVRRRRDPEAEQKEEFSLPLECKDLGKGKTFYIRTHGCQANEHDSETMSGILKEMGYVAVDEAKDADLIIVNTCAIRQNAEEKVFGEFGAFMEYKRKNPDLIIGMCGCMAQEEKTVERVLTTYPQVNLIFGTHNIYRLPELLYKAYHTDHKTVEVISGQAEVVEGMPASRKDKHKAWVHIMYGCDKFCTYCIVPYTRGKERSRRIGDIVKEVKALKDEGYKEVCLLGQNVNAYGLDLDMQHGFADLLEACALTGIERIRFMTSHPRNFDEETIDIIAKYPNIMPQIHLPVQSGSSAILKKMNRGYDRERYLSLFDEIKAKVPGACFTTDIIVGFPNETEEEFEETLTLYDHCQFDNAYTFIYSPRIGTPAAAMEDEISQEEKEKRLLRLNEKVKYYAHMHNEKYQDQIVEVLVDGFSKKDKNVYAGYTKGGKLVNFTANHSEVGELCNVKINVCHSFSFNGEKVED